MNTKPKPLTITHRNLPHWKKENSIYWITFRLADSIPAVKLKKWKSEKELWCRLHPKPWSENLWTEYHHRFGEKLEAWLDQGYGSCVFKDTCLREKLTKIILRFHNQRHRIHHGVIMPNHTHLLIEPCPGEDLSLILKGMKGTSARLCNQHLGKSGQFWMEESYDHIVRSQAQYDHYRQYIIDNPRKAHLRKNEYTLLP